MKLEGSRVRGRQKTVEGGEVEPGIKLQRQSLHHAVGRDPRKDQVKMALNGKTVGLDKALVRNSSP